MKTALGIYAFACFEMAMPMFGEIREADEGPSDRFLAAVWASSIEEIPLRSARVMYLGLRRDTSDVWNHPMPDRTEEQLEKNMKWRAETFG